MEISKQDWLLYRKKIGEWQEAYMEKLLLEYAELLRKESLASERFWELDICINMKAYGTDILFRRFSLFITPQHLGSGDYNRSLSRFMHLAFCCMLALP